MDTQKMEKFNYTNKTDAEMIRIGHVVPYVGPGTFVCVRSFGRISCPCGSLISFTIGIVVTRMWCIPLIMTVELLPVVLWQMTKHQDLPFSTCPGYGNVFAHFLLHSLQRLTNSESIFLKASSPSGIFVALSFKPQCRWMIDGKWECIWMSSHNTRALAVEHHANCNTTYVTDIRFG